MKKQEKSLQKSSLYNEAVQRAYWHVLKRAKQLLATIEQDELRFILERTDKSIPKVGTIVHEIVSPVLYLRLECHSDTIMAIHFGIEQITHVGHLSEITSMFLRTLFKYTSKELTNINIEQRVQTDWFINSCSAMYEYVELRNKYHIFKKLPYRVLAHQKKQVLSAAHQL